MYSLLRPRPCLAVRRWPRFTTHIRPNTTLSTAQTHSSVATVFKGPRTFRHVLFALGLSVFTYEVAAVWTDIDTAVKEEEFKALQPFGGNSVTTLDLYRMNNMAVIKSLRQRYADIQSALAGTPTLVKQTVSALTLSILQPYADASQGKRLCWNICLLNAGIYVLWKLGPSARVLSKYGMHNPLSGRVITLFTSVFSHRSLLHLLANCLFLESFGSAAYHHFHRSQQQQEPLLLESTTGPHFVAFLVSAGLFASLVSHLAVTKILYPRMIRSLSSDLSASSASAQVGTWASAVSKSMSEQSSRWRSTLSSSSQEVTTKQLNSHGILPSLGMSGALTACFMVTALAFPDSKISLFIPPTYPFSIQWGMYGMLLFDTIGVLRGWRLLDHYAHLGGYLFGALYWKYGPALWHWRRSKYDDEVRRIVHEDQAKED